MVEDEQTMGVSDNVCNLYSIPCHAAGGVQVHDKYMEDAERTNDQEPAGFFRRLLDEGIKYTHRAKALLAQR